jgi:hypothetical protein
MPSLQADVLRQLNRFLRNEISRTDLEDWVVQVSWSLARGSDPNAEDLLNQIELYFAEFSSRHRTVEDLTRLFGDLATSVRFDLAPQHRHGTRIRTSSAASDIRFEYLSR